MAKFIFDLPNEQLLPATFALVEKIETFSALIKVDNDPADEIPPVVREGGETDEQFRAKCAEVEKRKRAKNKKCIREMARKACLEHPKETADFTDSFWMVEKAGDKVPNAVVTFNKILTRDDVMSFFVSLRALA